MYYYGFGNYSSVAEKQKKAEKMVEKLRKKGQHIMPVAAFTGQMVTTFWGKSWCTNLESYADYENRLGRGRSYVRSGCVCHLEIKNGVVKALVNGTQLYSVTVKIAPLKQERWNKVCQACAGQTGSLLELLQGKISKNVMEKVCDTATGIFPSPKEIEIACSCPDWATMCKHVAAALYSIGRRLDTEPELLFVLRGVNATDLIATRLDFSQAVQAEPWAGDDLGALFGIDLDVEMKADMPSAMPQNPSAKKKSQKIPQNASDIKKKSSLQTENPKKATKVKAGRPIKPPFNPDLPTGTGINKLRVLANMSPADFARALGISFATLDKWCSEKGILKMRASSKACLIAFQSNLLRRRDP